jgi:ABC-2 type transport system permease protein
VHSKKGEIRLAIVFPEHFMEQLMHSHTVTIQFIADASDPNIATTVTNYAGAIIRDFQEDILKHPPGLIQYKPTTG